MSRTNRANKQKLNFSFVKFIDEITMMNWFSNLNLQMHFPVFSHVIEDTIVQPQQIRTNINNEFKQFNVNDQEFDNRLRLQTIGENNNYIKGLALKGCRDKHKIVEEIDANLTKETTITDVVMLGCDKSINPEYNIYNDSSTPGLIFKTTCEPHVCEEHKQDINLDF